MRQAYKEEYVFGSNRYYGNWSDQPDMKGWKWCDMTDFINDNKIVTVMNERTRTSFYCFQARQIRVENFPFVKASSLVASHVFQLLTFFKLSYQYYWFRLSFMFPLRLFIFLLVSFWLEKIAGQFIEFWSWFKYIIFLKRIKSRKNNYFFTAFLSW